MDRKTYELITQFVCGKYGVKLEFHTDIVPQADPVNKIIKLPHNIKDYNVYAAIALVMHEAAHVRSTIYDANKITDGNPNKFMILNAVEDIRIDLQNFDMLPNVRSFYKELMRKGINNVRDDIWRKAPLPIRVMATVIAITTGFMTFVKKDDEVKGLLTQWNLEVLVKRLINELTFLQGEITSHEIINKSPNCENRYAVVKEYLDKIYRILFPDQQLNQKSGQDQQGQEQGQEQGQDQQGQDGQGQDEEDQDGEEDQDEEDQGDEEDQEEEGFNNHEASALLRRSGKEVFSLTGNPSSRRGSAIVGLSFDSITKQAFKELLNQKLIKKVDSGTALNTDGLHSFFVDDVENLFSDEKVVKRKKSKIVLMLDSSGSMQSSMELEPRRRDEVLLEASSKIIDCIKEVQEICGLDIELQAYSFQSDTEEIRDGKLTEDYYDNFGGGTNLYRATMKAQEAFVKEDFDGEKLIVLITDGEVDDNEVIACQDLIVRRASDCKMLIIGIGASVNGSFATKILGNNNITCSSDSTSTIYEAIMGIL